jgi:predicted nucleic acid-binding protein
VIVVDSSVFIGVLREQRTAATDRLQNELNPDSVLVGDIVLLEVLRGADGERHAQALERELRKFRLARMLDPALAAKAAKNYRVLRRLGITVRKTPDLVIGTFCIERGHALLHNDRDFDPMVEHLGLRLA